MGVGRNSKLNHLTGMNVQKEKMLNPVEIMIFILLKFDVINQNGITDIDISFIKYFTGTQYRPN